MSKLPEIINKHEEQLRMDWLKQMSNAVRRADLMSDDEMKSQSRELLAGIAGAAKSGDITNLDGAAWATVRETLTSISASGSPRRSLT